MPSIPIVRVVLESAVLAALTALLCLSIPRLRATHRAFLWWLVSAKLLVGLMPLPAVRVAALPATAVAAPVASSFSASAAPALAAAPASFRLPLGTAIWAGCALLFAAAAIPGWLRVRRWVSSGRLLGHPAVARAAATVGLSRVPRVLVVPGLPSPLVTGLLRPVVLVPAETIGGLTGDELHMTLAHEMAHIARGDLWLGLVPAVARRLFFFHPAAWLAEREYAIAREAACDEIVLGHGADAYLYGRLLLQVATRRPSPAAIAMSRHSMLRRRLVMMDSLVRRSTIGRAGWAFVALAALAIVPVRLQAKDSGDQGCLEMGREDETAYVITDGSSHSMCGDVRDVALADAQRHGGDVIWFRVGDEDWVVHDPATVAEGHRLFQRVSEIGARQGEIGSRQSVIGAEQSKIGMEQGDIGLRQAKVALEQAAVELRRAELQKEDATREDRERLERELTEHERQLEQMQKGEHDARQQELSARMEALSRDQQIYGEQQQELSVKMEREVAEAQRALSDLLRQAMRDGRALKVE